MIADILFYLSSILLLLFFIRSIGPIRPVHIVPVLMAFWYGRRERTLLTRAQLQLYAAAAVGSLGLLSFLLYSELRFGHWNLYFSYVAQAWSSATGSGLEMNPIAILSKFRWPDPQT